MEEERDEEEVYRLVAKVYALNAGDQRIFIETLLDWFGDTGQERWFGWTCSALYPKSRWLKVDRWMEGQFRRDMSKRPQMVASMCVNHLRINSKMMPFLIKKAQRVKNRVYMRMKRAGEYNGG